MAAHQSKESFFSRNSLDTNETRDWYQVYSEMYHSAYDTTLIDSLSNVFIKGNKYYSDTVPIGIMNYSYWRLVDSTTLTTNDYFDFDTINNYLYDKPGRLNSPYMADAIFMASPLSNKKGFTQNITFLIDRKFIYESVFDSRFSTIETSDLKIDFGDGNGWVSFNTAQTTYHKVIYSGTGDYVIKTALFSGSIILMQSHARIAVTRPFTTPPNEIRSYPGLEVGIYGNCNNEGIVQKTIIYLPGYNPLDFADFDITVFGTEIKSYSRTISDIYADMLQNNQIIQLKNQGYRFVVVRWQNSGIDIRYNALYLMNLIEHLKAEQMEGTENFEQFVVIGESMGGLVGRYALTFMETENYGLGDYSRFFLSSITTNNALYTATHLGQLVSATNFRYRPERKHNTRLFITFDTPHQGANVPLSVQLAYKTVLNWLDKFINVTGITTSLNIGLEAMAAKQMLIYHADTKNISGNYFSHPYKYLFFADLKGMGDYPRLAKVVALSNGSLTGHGQLNGYTGADRVAGDRLFDLHIATYARILWFIKIPIVGADATLNTNPNGSGPLLNANAGHYWCRIKLKWFGIKISFGYNSLFAVSEDGNNIQPYCVNSGGYFNSIPSPVGRYEDGHDISNSDALNLFSWHTYNDGRGCHTLASHIGWNGFASVNLDYSFCSDGSNFCFIPTQSALDYGRLGSIPLNFDIEHENINTKLSNVPASVIIGYPDNITQEIRNSSFRSHNFGHLDYRNDRIQNIIRSGDNTFFSCSRIRDDVFRTMLSLEIGDEELYLENCNLDWLADYHAEYDLHINDRNPLYEYASQTGAVLGVYSKQNDFTILRNGFARLYYDRAASPTGIGINILAPLPDPDKIELHNEPQFSCCRNFFVPTKIKAPAFINTATSFLTVYPNPLGKDVLNIAYQFKQKGKVQLQLYDIMGKLHYSKEWLGDDASTQSKRSFNISPLNLHNGIYFVRLSNGKEVLHQQLIINKN